MVSEAHCMSFPCTELLLFNYTKVHFPFYGTFKIISSKKTIIQDWNDISVCKSRQNFNFRFNQNLTFKAAMCHLNEQ